MVYAICEFKGEPQPWQNGNSTAESYARREAREILAALQSRISPQSGMREVLEEICAETGDRGDGFIDWQRCVDRIQQRARAALSTAPIPMSEDAKGTCEYCGWAPDCGRIGCRVCDHGYYG